MNNTKIDNMQTENDYSFLLRDINRMLKKMNYNMVRTVWTATQAMLYE